MESVIPIDTVRKSVEHLLQNVMNEPNMTVSHGAVLQIRSELYKRFIMFLEACSIVTTHARRILLQSRDIELVRSNALCKTTAYRKPSHVYTIPLGHHIVSTGAIRKMMRSVRIRGLYRTPISMVRQVLWDVLVNYVEELLDIVGHNDDTLVLGSQIR